MQSGAFDQLARRMDATGSRRGLFRAFAAGVGAAVRGSLKPALSLIEEQAPAVVLGELKR
jgi:hypothetical protein